MFWFRYSSLVFVGFLFSRVVVLDTGGPVGWLLNFDGID
jgi:hypothetical protein